MTWQHDIIMFADTENAAEEELLASMSGASDMAANHGRIVITTGNIDTTNDVMTMSSTRFTRFTRSVRHFFARVGRTLLLCIQREPYDANNYRVIREPLSGDDEPIEEARDVDWIPENIRDRYIVPAHLLYDCVDVIIIHHIDDLTNALEYKADIESRNILVYGRLLQVKLLANIAVNQPFDQMKIAVSISTCVFVFVTATYMSDEVSRYMTDNILVKCLSARNKVGRLVPVYTSQSLLNPERDYPGIRILSYFTGAQESDRKRHFENIRNIFNSKFKAITNVRNENETRLNEARKAWIADVEQRREELHTGD